MIIRFSFSVRVVVASATEIVKMLSLAPVVILLLVSCCASAGVSMHDPFYCYSEDPIRSQIGMFGKKAMYDTTRGTIDPSASSCNPSKIWWLTRHGIRLPKTGEIRNMINYHEDLHKDILKNYKAGKTSLCASDYDLIKDWQFDTNITLEKEQYLTTAGWDEMEEIGRRFQVAFPSLFPSTYSESHYFFRATYRQRTLASLRAVADGLFGYNGFERIEFEEASQPDMLLRPHDNCELYLNVSLDTTETDAFKEGPEYQQMLTQVSTKLGFLGPKALRATEVETLADFCKYDQIWNINVTSPMCAAFSVANHEVLEYAEDIDFYFVSGYGFTEYRTLYENINCHLMQDMLHFLQSNDPSEQVARILSTHSTLLQLILVSFNVFEDEVPLHRHNFAQQAWRLWRSSINAPMATNIAVVRYDCDDGDNDVLFLFNENPFLLDGCQENGLCKQSFVIEKFKRFLDVNCGDVYCRNS